MVQKLWFKQFKLFNAFKRFERSKAVE